MKGNAVKGIMEVIGANRLISPKTPPYRLEMTCNHLLANSLNPNAATSVTATKNVKCTLINMRNSPSMPPRGKKIPTRYDCL